MAKSLEEKFDLTHKPTQAEPWCSLSYKEGKNVYAFIEFVNSLTNIASLNAYKQPILFRGQANSQWRLEPKMYRLVRGIRKEHALRMEFDSIKYFKQQAHLFLGQHLVPAPNDVGEWLGLMQHYSAPTRMLDWTSSFNVALYFATTGQPVDSDGAVWLFWVDGLYRAMEKYADLSKEEVADILSSEKKFVEFGCTKAKPKIDTYDMSIKSERMIAQQTIFTYCDELFCDHADLIGNALMDSVQDNREFGYLFKIIISPETKRKVRQHLHKLNLCAATLFPGADGVGRAISEIIMVQRDVFYGNEEKSSNTERGK